MSHEEAFSELAGVALDCVSVEVASAVRAHAALCPECGPELAAMEATATTLAGLVPSVQINRGRSAGIRSRLLVRARSERETRSAPVPGPPDISRGVASLTGQGQRVTPGAQRVVTGETKRVTAGKPTRVPLDVAPISSTSNWFAIAAAIAVIATGVQLFRVTSERNRMRAQISAPDTTALQRDSLTRVLSQRDSMIAAMTGPEVKVVALGNQGGRQQPLGRMMWNQSSNDWIMVMYNLRPPKPGMTYQVWLVTDSEKISAGTFKPDAQGKTMMHARYTMARNALRAVAITEEPEGGMPAPTGPMVVAGAA